MADQEVGRWKCEKCDRTIVAIGHRSPTFKGTGAYTGQCPWSCGAWVNRAFRAIRPGEVRALRAEEWDQRPLSRG